MSWKHVKRTRVEFDGKAYSLQSWCTANSVPYSLGLARWEEGVRNPIELLYGEDKIPKMPEIPESDIRFLKKSRYARKGQKDEWEIACDLIAQPYVRIPEIRKMVLE